MLGSLTFHFYTSKFQYIRIANFQLIREFKLKKSLQEFDPNRNIFLFFISRVSEFEFQRTKVKREKHRRESLKGSKVNNWTYYWNQPRNLAEKVLKNFIHFFVSLHLLSKVPFHKNSDLILYSCYTNFLIFSI